jgi:hypothetical protein
MLITPNYSNVDDTTVFEILQILKQYQMFYGDSKVKIRCVKKRVQTNILCMSRIL